MPRKARKLDVACPNPNCRCYKKIGLKNIIRKGKQKNGTKRYQCTECKRTFSRTINTPFFHKHLEKKEIITICKMLSEKNGFRAIARVTSHHRDTICSIASAVAEHSKKFSSYFTKELKLTPVEVDEMWSFVKKKKKTAFQRASRKGKSAMHIHTQLSKEIRSSLFALPSENGMILPAIVFMNCFLAECVFQRENAGLPSFQMVICKTLQQYKIIFQTVQ